MTLAAAAVKPIEGEYEFGSDNTDMVLKTLQRVAGYAAWTTTGSGVIACVIADFGQYNDGLVLDGRFIRIGTYSFIGELNRIKYTWFYDPRNYTR